MQNRGQTWSENSRPEPHYSKTEKVLLTTLATLSLLYYFSFQEPIKINTNPNLGETFRRELKESRNYKLEPIPNRLSPKRDLFYRPFKKHKPTKQYRA